jgi:acyl dehydratase
MSSDTQDAAPSIAMRGIVGTTFDELNVGDEHWSPGRTVTETDIVNFCALSGDWNPHHSDALFSGETALGERLAPAALVVAITTGLVVRLRVFEGTIVALLEWTYKFTKPVVIGTRLQVRLRVLSKRETSNPARGVVRWEVAAFNENDEQAAVGEWTMLMLRNSLPV